jgi:inner membrane protein
MDNLTHTLVGALIARAAFTRRIPAAAPLVMIAANLPDADIAAGLKSPLCYLEYHRHWTHAIPFAPLQAAALWALWWLLSRRKGLTRAQAAGGFAAALAGVLSHPLLDWLNVYGIRLWLPWRGDWSNLDLVFIVDVWIWALLLLFTLGPLLARLVYGEIGARRPAGRGGAWAALALLGLYIGARGVLHARAVETLNARLHGGEAPLRVAAAPHPAIPWVWTGLVETRSAVRMARVDLTRDFDPDSARVFYRPDAAPFEAAVRATETGRVFFGFAQWPLWRITPAPAMDGGLIVRIHDLRFGAPEEGRFVAEFLVDGSGKVLRERFVFGTLGTGEKEPGGRRL